MQLSKVILKTGSSIFTSDGEDLISQPKKL